jgi:hypothetical protein
MGEAETGTTHGLPLPEAEKRLDSRDVSTLSFGEIVSAFLNDKTVAPYLPHPDRSEDPRSGLPVFYSESRAGRPHTYGSRPGDCPICRGNITRILDLRPLPSGIEGEYSFINKNLYPIAWPQAGSGWGLHFLFWPSNLHERNFRNMEPETAAEALSRIAVLERTLLSGDRAGGSFPEDGPDGNGPAQDGTGNGPTGDGSERPERGGFVCLIKNEGAQVGGSIAHDHFQLLYTGTEPLRFREDRLFLERRGEPFTRWLMRETGAGLTAGGSARWTAAVPPFMRRPYDLVLFHTDEEKRYLHQLDRTDLLELATLLGAVFRASDELFARLRRRPAFNLIAHNSGAGGLYFEFLPYTQETGGFEQLGLYLSQARPEQTASFYRPFLGG